MHRAALHLLDAGVISLATVHAPECISRNSSWARSLIFSVKASEIGTAI